MEDIKRARILSIAKKELARTVDGMEDWQARLVLSFVRTLFETGPKPADEQTEKQIEEKTA